MSGIYIPDMEMPRHCGECAIELCERWKKLIIAGMSIAKSRPKDCPLVPVPDHGRLGDLNALYNELVLDTDTSVMASAKRINEYMQLKIDDAPTVIPAEGVRHE